MLTVHRCAQCGADFAGRSTRRYCSKSCSQRRAYERARRNAISALGIGEVSLLTQARKSRGLSLGAVAAEVRTHPTNLSRVERGQQLPLRQLARNLFEYYRGAVPLGAIYDPEFFAQSNARD